jgi:reductive dehalogenase
MLSLDPTTEIDWNLLTPFQKHRYNNFSQHQTPEDAAAIRAATREAKVGWLNSGNKPGLDLRGQAVKVGGWGGKLFRRADPNWYQYFHEGTKTVPTPAQMQTQKWQGTPEENARMVRAFLRVAGASTVGFVDLDQKTKKLVWSNVYHPPFAPYVYEEVEHPIADPTKAVIPNKCRYVVVYTIRQSLRLSELGTTWMSDAAAGFAYDNCDIVQYRLQNFLRVLGYDCIGMPIHGLGPIAGWGNMAGLGEVGRLQHLITPDWGPMIRESVTNITDIPVAPNNPIDFGANRFCYACTKCADACPGSALRTEKEPSWDITPATDLIKPELFNNPGIKTWFFSHFFCNRYWGETDTYCGICQAICVFSKEDIGSIHEVVKAAISNTSIFNGFFTNMDDMFGYGVAKEEDYESWWDAELPVNGIDYSIDPYL